MANQSVTATGSSGTTFTLVAYQMNNTTWNDVPVIYMFARLDIGNWFVAYIGQAQSAKDRLPCHERWDEAVRVHRATHVLALVASANSDARERAERDLILSHNPPMNIHHRSGTGLLGLAG